MDWTTAGNRQHWPWRVRHLAAKRAEPPGLSKVDSRITEQQAQLIGVTMDTAAKLSAFIDDADRRHTATTMASKNGPIGAPECDPCRRPVS